MKLKKSDTDWCWVNFKYENLPTFCFICGMVGHSDKFCEKLFDTMDGNIEEPFGAWMRDEPRRRTYMMGNKWLRHGSSFPVKNTVDEDKADSSIISDEIHNVESGIQIARKAGEQPASVGGNNRRLPKQTISNQSLLPQNQGKIIHTEGNDNAEDLDELIVTKPKCLKLDTVYGPETIENPEMEMEASPEGNEDLNQKNEFLAGAASQARHSS